MEIHKKTDTDCNVLIAIQETYQTLTAYSLKIINFFPYKIHSNYMSKFNATLNS